MMSAEMSGVASRWQRRTSMIVVVTVSTALLAGCAGNSSNVFGSLTGDPVPPPVAATPPQSTKAKLAFMPVVGAPADVSAKISGSVAAAMGRQNIPVAKAGEPSDYAVRGYVVAAPGKGSTKITYIWDVTDKAGQRVNRVKGEELVKSAGGSDPWAAMDEATIGKIAESTSAQLAAWVPDKPPAAAPAAGVPVAETSTTNASTSQIAAATPNTLPAPVGTTNAQPVSLSPSAGSVQPVDGQVVTASAAAVPARNSAYVMPVTGAPGDGQALLTQAVQKHLAAAGVELVQAKGPGDYTVQGVVTMGPPANGKQKVTIVWKVLDPNGNSAGEATQSNTVPQGALDGTWGRTADLAAKEASNGIVDLISHNRKLKAARAKQPAQATQVN